MWLRVFWNRMGPQPGRQSSLIDFAFSNLFKGDDFFHRRSINIMTIQYEKKPCDNIGSPFIPINKAVISG